MCNVPSFLEVLAKAEETLGEHSDPSSLYMLAWLYSLYQELGFREEEWFDRMKVAVLDLLEDNKRYKIVISSHKSAAGLLFSLYHLASKRENIREYSLRVLNDIKDLNWHEFDGEIMAYSYMLAKAVRTSEILEELGRNIDNKVREWLGSPAKTPQKIRDIIYIFFTYLYILDEKLVEVLEILKQHKQVLLQIILNSEDVEIIALALYVLARIAYNKRLKQLFKKRELKTYLEIREDIFKLSNVLNTFIKLNKESLRNMAPKDLLAKIELAMLESGLDKPYVLSKYERKRYQEIRRSLESGYMMVNRKHLLCIIILNVLILLIITTLGGIWLAIDLVRALASINVLISIFIYTHGSINLKQLLQKIIERL